MPQSPAQAIMERETRVTYGPVPHGLLGEDIADKRWQLVQDRFLLRENGSHYFYYRKGEGITVERGPGADIASEQLWLNGSVYAAVASINGLLPIHASAVAHDGRVFAFTGPAGAGKSTLVAALGHHGLPMFCDDTLVLDLSDPGRITCLPGHKRLKLTPEAFELTGAARHEEVGANIGKFFASPPGGIVGEPLELAELIFLGEGGACAISPVTGGDRLLGLRDDHYTSEFFAAAHKFEPEEGFALDMRLTRQSAMSRLVRPMDEAHFAESVALAARHVTRR